MEDHEQVVFINSMRSLLNLKPDEVLPPVILGAYGREDYEVVLSLIEKRYLGSDPRMRGDSFYLCVTEKGIQEFERIFKTKWQPPEEGQNPVDSGRSVGAPFVRSSYAS